MTTQESRLVITIDTRNADKAVKELQKELAKLQSQGNKSSESTKNQGQQTQIVNNIVQNFTTTVNNNSKALGNNTTTVNNNSNALGRQAQSAQSASNAMKALAATVFAYVSVSKLVDSADTYTNLKNRLKLVTDTQQELNVALNDTHKIAMTTSSDWLGVSTIYQRFAQNGEKLGLTQQRIARITETVSKAVSISGASAEGANAAMMQLGQALASGVLRGEEFNSVNEQTPAVLDAIARGIGVQRGELKEMAGDGKLTAEVLVSAFEKSGASVDELFARTQTTIKGSLNMLKTEFTKYIGEADSGSGATKVFVESITVLAKNIETVFNVATVAGVGYLTKALITQSLVMKANALASIENRANHLATLQTQAQLTAVEASRTLAVKELTAMQLADAQATMARMTGMQRLAYMQATVLPLEAKLTQATAAHAVATEADTVAQNANTAARSRAAMVMGALGGVTGLLTIGVMAGAVAYMAYKRHTQNATDELERQTQVASKTKEELLALEGAQRKGAKNDMEASFKTQNKALKDLNFSFNSAVIAIQNSNQGNLEVITISNKVRSGIISQTEAIKQLNLIKTVTPEQINQLQKAKDEYDKQLPIVQQLQRSLEIYGVKVKLAGNESSNATPKFDQATDSLNKQADAVDKTAKAYDELLKKKQAEAKQSVWVAEYAQRTGMSVDKASFFAEMKAANDGKAITQEQANAWNILYKQMQATSDLSAKRAEQEREVTKEKKAQIKAEEKLSKAGNRLVGLVGSTGSSTGNHLHIQYPKGSGKGAVTAEHLARFELGGRTLSTKNQGSPYGEKRSSGPHGGIDFPAPAGTPITTNVGVKSVTKHIQKEGGKVVGGGYYSRVTFEDGVVIDLMHQIPEMMSKVKGGASKGNATKSANDAYDSFLDDQKEAERLEKERRTLGQSLITESLNYVDRLDAELGKKLQDVEFAIFDRPEHKQQLINFYTKRAELQRDLFVKQQNYELDEWQMSNEQKLTAQHEINRIRLQLEVDYNEELMQERDKSQTAQYEKALALNMLEIEKRKLSVTEAFLDEEWIIRKRYDLERFEIQQTAEAHEKDFLIRMSKLRQLEESQERINQARITYANTLDMNDYQRLNSERVSKESASIGLFSAELGRVDAQAQVDPNIDQMELLLQRQAILKAHNDRMYAIDQEYFLKKAELGVASAQSTMGMWSGIFGEMLGEQSGFYQTAFALEKGFAVAKAMINIPKTYSDTFASVSAIPVVGPYIAQPMAIAAAAGQVVQAGMIKNVQPPTGYATGGLIRGAGTGTSDSIPIMASNQEFMIKASSVSKIGQANLDYINKYGELPQQTQRVGQNTLNALSNSEARQAERSKASSVQQAPQVNVNPQIVITDERQSIADFMASRSGEQIIMKTLKRNGIAK